MKKEIENITGKWTLWLALGLVGMGLWSCAGKKIIRTDGLHAIKIGEPLPPPGTEKLAGISLRDTLLEEREYAWRAALMEYEEGLVYLEEDFFGSPKVNRIRIETPELKLKNGLRVGKTVADLRETKSEWFIFAYPEFEVFDFYSRKFPQIHFLIETEHVKMDREDPDDYDLAAFDDSDPIVGIVVF